jgi:hypothetical protein
MVEEKRRHRRFFGPALNVTIFDEIANQRSCGTVSNCSLGGMELIVEELLPRGRVLRVCLPGEVSVDVVLRECRTRCGILIAGCKFTEPLSQAAMTVLRLNDRTTPTGMTARRG